jgi:hypothetical protein
MSSTTHRAAVKASRPCPDSRSASGESERTAASDRLPDRERENAELSGRSLSAVDTNILHIQACRNGQGFRGRKSLKLRWQLAARLGLHVLLMHLKRVASAAQHCAGLRLVTSRKAIAAARLPRSNAVGKAPTLIATPRRGQTDHTVGIRQAANSAPSLRWALRATAQLPCRDGIHGVLHSSGRSRYNTS